MLDRLDAKEAELVAGAPPPIRAPDIGWLMKSFWQTGGKTLNESNLVLHAQSIVPDVSRVAEIAAEVVAICRFGFAYIDDMSHDMLTVQGSTVERLAREYSRAVKSRESGAAAEVKKLLSDGLRGFNEYRKDIDYEFVRRLTFGPIGEMNAEQAGSDSSKTQKTESDAWAEPYRPYIADYVIYILGLINAAKKRRRTLRRLLCLGIILILVTFFGANLAGGITWVGRTLRVFTALGTIICAWLFTRYSYVRELALSSVHRTLGREVSPLPNRSALSLQLRAGIVRPVEPLEAEIFALAIIRPASLRQRISERYEPGRRTLWQEVTVEIQIPGELIQPEEALGSIDKVSGISQEELAESEVFNRRSKFAALGRIPFPVVIPPKGELNDEIVVQSGNDERLPCFSYSEYLLIVASVLRMLLLKSYQLDNVNLLPKKGSEAERKALACIMQRGIPSEQIVNEASDAILNLSRVEQDEPIRDPEALKIAAELVRKLSGRYAIVASVECTPEGRMILEYRRKLVPVLELGLYQKGFRFRWLFDRFSILLGARPVDLTVPLENASSCQSFHIYIDCPEGLYLRSQQIDGLNEFLNRYDRQRSTIPPYYRLRRRLGQSYAHLYARAFPAPKAGEALPELRVSFWEVPPGSLFRAAVVSVSTALLIWLVGWVLARVPDPGTDIPAVILAFPAVAAAWLGFDEKRRRLLEGTLVSRLSLMLSAAFALSASGLFMLNKANLPVLHDPIPFPITITFLGINQGSWGVLVFISIVNALGVSYLCLLRTREFEYLAARPDPTSAVRER